MVLGKHTSERGQLKQATCQGSLLIIAQRPAKAAPAQRSPVPTQSRPNDSRLMMMMIYDSNTHTINRLFLEILQLLTLLARAALTDTKRPLERGARAFWLSK